ncbi:MAG TPA: MFS transporter [Sphingopyxis sp.]|nr:MFS transporter [Sphingopyxis sp.]HMP46464.1 MFS transporter [Sphingopyxis sp.]HMQ18032.1 MFS transporter [Sphingopyxis sp.]
MATVTAPPSAPARLDRPGLAWALFEGGRIPYVIMLSVVFMPYFAKTVVGDAVAGQAEVANFAKYAGFVAACTAPLLGALLDQRGRRKPWIVAFMAVLVSVVAMLWFAEPDAAGLPVATIVVLLVLGKLFYTYTEMLHNSLLAAAAAGGSMARLSGLSITIGATSGFLFLIFILLTIVLPTQGGVSFVPAEPLFGLDTESYQHLRIVPLFAAALLVAASLPLLLFARDYPPTRKSWGASFDGAFAYLGGLVGHLKARPNAAKFLLARMVYADGITATSIFTGVLAAGVMGWSATELLLLGIGQLAAAAAGAHVFARLDMRVGSKRALQIMLTGMIVVLIAVVGTAPDRIVFVPLGGEAAAFWDGPAFTRATDLIFLALLLAKTGLASGTSASSRALLGALSPASEAGAYFGLYAMAGTVTAWLAPLAIGWATQATGSQQAGFVPVIVLLAIGLALLATVKTAATAEKHA